MQADIFALAALSVHPLMSFARHAHSAAAAPFLLVGSGCLYPFLLTVRVMIGRIGLAVSLMTDIAYRLVLAGGGAAGVIRGLVAADIALVVIIIIGMQADVFALAALSVHPLMGFARHAHSAAAAPLLLVGSGCLYPFLLTVRIVIDRIGLAVSLLADLAYRLVLTGGGAAGVTRSLDDAKALFISAASALAASLMTVLCTGRLLLRLCSHIMTAVIVGADACLNAGSALSNHSG